MPTHALRPALLALTLLSGAAHGAAITVWEHSDFRGASIVFDRAVTNLATIGWNDRVSSIRVDSGRWEVCRDHEFSGCRTLSADMGEMRSLESGWNDVLSSLRPVGEASAESPEQVARRLYRAILGRDPDPEGLRNATTQVERRQIETLVRGMVQSAEYRSLRSQRSADQLLDQIYQGLYGNNADAAARRAYTIPLERGEDAQVVLAILDSGGAAAPGAATPIAQTPAQDYRLDADGAGFVVWGANGRYESLSGASIILTRDGKAQVDLAGTTPQTLRGSWTRDGDDVLRLQIPDIGDRRVDAAGRVLLEAGRLARVEVTAGTIGSRNQILFTFLADAHRPPREETRCVEEARAELEAARGAPLVLLFLAPERTRSSSGRDQLRGDGVILADPGSFSYRCEVDARRGEVLDATVQRR